MKQDRKESIDRLVAYGFSPAVIEYLEKKVWGITKDSVMSDLLFKDFEKALGVSKTSSDLEKAYFKLKFIEMTRGCNGSTVYSQECQDYISQLKPLDPIIFSKLEFYDFSFQDFVKIKSDLFPYLVQIITDVEKIYGVPEKLSKDVKEQVKDHLMQELGIIKIN